MNSSQHVIGSLHSQPEVPAHGLIQTTPTRPLPRNPNIHPHPTATSQVEERLSRSTERDFISASVGRKDNPAEQASPPPASPFSPRPVETPRSVENELLDRLIPPIHAAQTSKRPRALSYLPEKFKKKNQKSCTLQGADSREGREKNAPRTSNAIETPLKATTLIFPHKALSTPPAGLRHLPSTPQKPRPVMEAISQQDGSPFSSPDTCNGPGGEWLSIPSVKVDNAHDGPVVPPKDQDNDNGNSGGDGISTTPALGPDHPLRPTDRAGQPPLAINTNDSVMASFTNHDQLSPNGGGTSNEEAATKSKGTQEVVEDRASPSHPGVSSASMDVEKPSASQPHPTVAPGTSPLETTHSPIFTPSQVNTFFVDGEQYNIRSMVQMVGGELVQLEDAQFVILPLRVGDSVTHPRHIALARREGVHPLGRVVSREWVTECWSRETLVDPTPFVVPPPAAEVSPPPLPLPTISNSRPLPASPSIQAEAEVEAVRTKSTTPTPDPQPSPPPKNHTETPKNQTKSGALQPVVAALIVATSPANDQDTAPIAPTPRVNHDLLVPEARSSPAPRVLAQRSNSTPCPSPRNRTSNRNRKRPRDGDGNAEVPPERPARSSSGPLPSLQSPTSTPTLSPPPESSGPADLTPTTPLSSTLLDAIDAADRNTVSFLVTSIRTWLSSGARGGKIAFMRNLPRKGLNIAPYTAYCRYKAAIDSEIPEMCEFKTGSGRRGDSSPERSDAKRVKK